jgi:hypothetical protein
VGQRRKTALADQPAGTGNPGWWPYTAEFPHWHVWRGVAGLLYARRPRSSPPKVVRGKDAAALRERIIQAEVSR